MREPRCGPILGKPEDFGCAAVFVAEAGGRTVGFGACGENQRDKALSNAGYSEEIDEQPDVTLIEDAYGWCDLSSFGS
jgi:hypothetical protein